MFRTAVCATFICAFALPATAQNEREFLRERYKKTFLSDTASKMEFSKSLRSLLQLVEGDERQKRPDKAIEGFDLIYTRAKSLAKNKDGRLEPCLRQVLAFRQSKYWTHLKRFPDELIVPLIGYLKKEPADGPSKFDVIDFLAVLGPQSAKALPALIEIRDGSDTHLALAAAMAIEKIKPKAP